MEFDLGDSGLTYIPGDALGIYPSNCPQAVDELLQVLGLAGAEAVACPGWHYADVEGTTPQQLTLREVLTHCYDLRWVVFSGVVGCFGVLVRVGTYCWVLVRVVGCFRVLVRVGTCWYAVVRVCIIDWQVRCPPPGAPNPTS